MFYCTYWSEFHQCIEQLYHQGHGSLIDIGVQNVQMLLTEVNSTSVSNSCTTRGMALSLILEYRMFRCYLLKWIPPVYRTVVPPGAWLSHWYWSTECSDVTYWSEFHQCIEQLNHQGHGSLVDIGVQNVQELCCFCHQVDWLDVVWLFSQIVLQWVNKKHKCSWRKLSALVWNHCLNLSLIFCILSTKFW